MPILRILEIYENSLKCIDNKRQNQYKLSPKLSDTIQNSTFCTVPLSNVPLVSLLFIL
jgi:hypothetical protein